MPRITMVPPLDKRPETGPMQFGDDWPGIFIRGDEALFTAAYIDHALKTLPPHPYINRMLEGVRDTLRSCSASDTGWPPHV